MTGKDPRPAQEGLTESERALLDCVSEVVDMGLGPLRMGRRDLGCIPGGGCSRVQVDRLLQIIDRLVLALATAQSERDAAVELVALLRPTIDGKSTLHGRDVDIHWKLQAYDALRAGKGTST